MTQGQADVIAADIADVDVDLWVTNDTIIMPVCLAAGTRVLTTRGERAIENLAVGDLVVTADRGAVPIRWIGSSTYLARDFAVDPRHLPIRIKAGCLGNDVPSRDLVVSPQHRILLASKVVERMFANDEILVPAKRLLGLPGVEVMRSCREVIYMHLLFDEHEVFFAEHTPVESLLMGPMAMRSFSREQVEEIKAVFPELVGADTVPASARPMPQAGRANRLVKRYLKNEMQPLEL
ncbi:type I secretion target repeat protein [Pseudooceanicola batsensis HTCC2597]|uniref:Type I secretion target repeat protein n=1 Tax=Pseudooceanicola batsensis (strain ATCC BAA-863 / DSM 15984 / KCTC 12145 / HTCC2597) TaxID=252305 RepID=A3TTF8_PSEBH|nr:Hint domain-containing protein [Pseudooceanicola batsensis]EAQ04935.1 type I secretion target repeat protein [Pseudooceanicola batsensis HTCC2597]